MYIFIGLFDLVLELIPLFLFIGIIIYLAKNKNQIMGKVDNTTTDISNNSSRKNNSEKNKKIGSILTFLCMILPCILILITILLLSCSGGHEICKDGVRYFWMDVLCWVFIIDICLIIPLLISVNKSSTTKDAKIQKYEGGNPQDTNSQVVSVIQSFSTTDIDSIHFAEKSGKSYTIKLDSIKKIAKYIEYKYHKTTFDPNELALEKEYLIQNYTSDLSEENYNLVVTTLSNWVSTGGKFDIIMKK